jgi:hypothetical protein
MSLSALPRTRFARAERSDPTDLVVARRTAAPGRGAGDDRHGARTPAEPGASPGPAGQQVVRRLRHLLHDDAGMSTVEYAIGLVAAAGFAALLYSVVTGDSVTAALTQLVQRALTAGA